MAAPAEVTNLTGRAYDTAIALGWVDPVDVNLDHIKITHDQAGGAPGVEVAAGVEGYTWEGLTNGVEYTFTVKTSDVADNTSTGETQASTPDGGASTYGGYSLYKRYRRNSSIVVGGFDK